MRIHEVTHAILYAFIDAHRDAYGVEAICRVLEIAPSAYYVYRQRQVDATRLTPRAQRKARSCALKSRAFTASPTRSTVSRNCGASCSATARSSRAARWSA